MSTNLPALRQDVVPVEETAPAPSPPAVEQAGPALPVPVAITSDRLAMLRECFGPATADRLQSAWGDKTLHRLEEINALAIDHSRFGEIVAKHETPDGGLSMKGIEAAAEYLVEKAGLADADDLARRHPGLHAVFLEDRTHDGISAAGLYKALSYIARSTGYRFTFGGSAPSQRQETPMSDSEDQRPASPPGGDIEDQLDTLRERIEEAQARGNSKRANELYQQEQALRASRGNAPIVGSQGRTA